MIEDAEQDVNHIGAASPAVHTKAVPTFLACAPVTALCFLDPSPFLLAGQGSYLKLFDVRAAEHSALNLKHQLKIWAFQRIHGIVRQQAFEKAQEQILVFGGKQAGLVRHDRASSTLSLVSTWTAPDWLLAAAWLKDTALLLTSHNVVLSYRINGPGAHLTTQGKIQCVESPLLWCGSFSSSNYDSTEAVYVAAGTIMNEILIWRPFHGLQVERRLLGHHGSIFFVVFQKSTSFDSYTLASGSDDRDVRLWTWNSSSTSYQVCVLQGHTHRPWRAAFTGDSQQLVTTGEDLRTLVWDCRDPDDVQRRRLVAEHHGHTGKNIWSVDIARSSALMATGGADGSVRLSRVVRTQKASTLQDAYADTIVAFDASDTHVLFVTRRGRIYCASGNDGFQDAHLLHTYLDGTTTVQAVAIVRNNVGRLFLRDGTIISLALTVSTRVRYTETRYRPTAVAIDADGGRWALYDLKKQKLAVLRVDDQSVHGEPLGELHLPDAQQAKHIAWLDSQHIAVADTRSHFWLVGLGADCIMQLLWSGQVGAGPLHCLEPDRFAPLSLWCGSDANCKQYSFQNTTGSPSAPSLTHEDILDAGAVRDIRVCSAHLRQYLACENGVARILSSTGEPILTLQLPGRSAHSTKYLCSGLRSMLLSNTGAHILCTEVSPDASSFLQPGLHGREIWAVDLIELGAQGDILCATASEDNTVKIATVCSEYISTACVSAQPSLRTFSTIPMPEGNIQNVKFSRGLSHSGSYAILFIASAGESLSAFKIVTDSSVTHARVKRLAHSHCTSHLSARDARRIMTLGITVYAETHRLIVGYSDGAIEHWFYDESSNSFDRQWSSRWHDRCLLASDIMVRDRDLLALTAATDGRIALWKLDNNDAGPVCIIESVHQSGVNALAASVVDGKLQVISGGDDGIICCTTLEVTLAAVVTLERVTSAAHASSVKGIAVLGDGTFVSTSTDQRVIRWIKCKAELRRLQTIVSEVADIAGLSVVGSRQGEPGITIAVSGLGLELVDYQRL